MIQDEQHTSALVAAGAKKANILSLACVRGIGFDPLSFTARAVPITIDLPLCRRRTGVIGGLRQVRAGRRTLQMVLLAAR